MSHSLLNEQNLLTTPIQEGDVGIVIKPNGDWKVFTTGTIDPEHLTDEQQVQGERLVGLTIALSIPQVMDMLIKMANDPQVTGKNIISLKRHS